MWLRHHSPPPPFSSLISSAFCCHSFVSSAEHSDPHFSSSGRCLDTKGESKVQSTPEMESVTCGEEPIGINEKLCVDCKTSKTPLWRSGPAGPKSLCNACGIRFRKKRSPAPSDKKREKQAPSCPSPSPSPSSSSCSTSAAAHTVSFRNREDVEDAGMRKKLRVKLVAVGKEVVVLQRRRSRMMKKVKRDRIEKEYKKLGEVEQAAFLLMSMSCGGSVFR